MQEQAPIDKIKINLTLVAVTLCGRREAKGHGQMRTKSRNRGKERVRYMRPKFFLGTD